MDLVAADSSEALDRSLISAAQRGERRALDAFIRRHDRWVRGIVFSTVDNASLVDDVVQGIWTKVWQQIGTLVDSTRWRGWLYTLARNAAIDAGQKRARERKQCLRMTDGDYSDRRDGDPLSALVRSEEHRRMLGAIRGLPSIYREPFVLRHLDGWSYAQIGDALSLPVDTVETRLVRARRLLRDALRPGDNNGRLRTTPAAQAGA